MSESHEQAEVIAPTPQEIQVARVNAIQASGLSEPELYRQGAVRRFDTLDAQISWMVVQATDGDLHLIRAMRAHAIRTSGMDEQELYEVGPHLVLHDHARVCWMLVTMADEAIAAGVALPDHE